MSQPGDFWTRRRAAVAEEAALAAPEAKVDTAAPPEERTDAEILADLDLPDPDTLKIGDDVTGFMARAVPEHLRRRALRRLWRLNPVLANLDGLVDYGEDFTDSATVIEGLQTTYQVGKGMLAHVQEMARQAEAAEAAGEEANDPPAQPAEVETVEEPAPAPKPAIPPQTATAEDAAPEAEEATAPDPTTLVAYPPRRMRFVFGGAVDTVDATTGKT